MNEDNKEKCFVCGCNNAIKIANYDPVCVYYNCPVCGRYQLYFESADGRSIKDRIDIDRNKLASFLFYKGFKTKDNQFENRYYTTMDGNNCDKYAKEYEQNHTGYGYPIHIENEDIELWYPNKFSEKIDMILLCFHTLSKHIGEEVELSKEEMLSCVFADRFDFDGRNYKERDNRKVTNQAFYILQYMIDSGYLQGGAVLHGEEKFDPLKITPKGYARIDELQKNDFSESKDVFVAMQFGDKSKSIREAIREGILSANYIPIFIDEVPHNNFITPEILKRIKDSKFVVADLTFGNQGAYLEEGYAMGLGKPVIQLCRSDEPMHFDIKQKNTIMWEKESDIPELLKKRIEATIE